MNEKKGQFSNKQFVQYIMPGLKKLPGMWTLGQL